MKQPTQILAAVAGAALLLPSVTSAAPLNTRANEVDLTCIEDIYPTAVSSYYGWNGAVTYGVKEGQVNRWQGGPGDITALVSFQVPAAYAADEYVCEVAFQFRQDRGSCLTGTKRAQIFTALAPATASAWSWPSGNLRDQYLGTIQAEYDTYATWVPGEGSAPATKGRFPCSAIAGKLYGGEIVPQGDNDKLSWIVGSNDGPVVKVYKKNP